MFLVAYFIIIVGASFNIFQIFITHTRCRRVWAALHQKALPNSCEFIGYPRLVNNSHEPMNAESDVVDDIACEAAMFPDWVVE